MRLKKVIFVIFLSMSMPYLAIAGGEKAFYAKDGHGRRALEELKLACDWASGEKIIISEFGVPTQRDQEAYAELMDLVLSASTFCGMSSVVWADGDWWGDYILSFADAASNVSRVVSSYRSEGEILRGVSVAGGEFGMSPDWNSDHHKIGNHGQSYIYHHESEVWQRAVDRHFTHVRIPFRLERLFQSDGSFDEKDKNLFVQMIEAAGSHGLKVILDPHNYGSLVVDGEQHNLGYGKFSEDLYLRMMRNLTLFATKHPDVIDMIGLMNEPKNVVKPKPDGGWDVDVEKWERISQAAVDMMRSLEYKNSIEVPIANWQGMHDLSWMHARGPWVSDPLDLVYYGMHQYYNPEHSGFYENSYTHDEKILSEKYVPGEVILTSYR